MNLTDNERQRFAEWCDAQIADCEDRKSRHQDLMVGAMLTDIENKRIKALIFVKNQLANQGQAS